MARNKKGKPERPPVATSATNSPKRFNRGKDGTFPLDKSFRPNPKGVVEELGGDGLQTLRVTWSNASLGMAEGDFWRYLETILGNCYEVMRRYDWDRGNGRNFPNDRTSEPFSELWYAGKIGNECWNLINWHRKRGPNEIALAQALYLGRLLTAAEWDGFKHSITKYRRSKEGAAKGRDDGNAEKRNKKNERQFEIEAIARKTDLKGGARERLIRDHFLKDDRKVSTRTIRRSLKKMNERQKQR